MKRTSAIILFVICFFPCLAQRQPVPPQQLREADITFSKRTWRLIDLRERQNKIAVWPRNPLPKILYDAVTTGKLRPYNDDSLKTFMDLEQFGKKGTDTFLVKKLLDPNGEDDGPYTTDTVVELFKPTDRIKQLLLMEEWYFDSKQGMHRAQIIAVAPLYEKTVAGVNLGYIPLCWFKYYDRFDKETDCRDILVNQLMFNDGNPYHKFSYDDWFEQRKFSGFVIKESNPYDIYLADDPDVKRNGLQALIKAARAKQEMLEQEHDMYEP